MRKSKFLFLLILLLGTHMAFCQGPDLPVDFDDTGIDYGIYSFGAGFGASIGVDPDDATNSVLCTTKEAASDCWSGSSGNCIDTPIPFTASNQTMTVDVYSPAAGTPILLKVEVCSDGAIFAQVLQATTGVGWETLTFDFTTSCPSAVDLSQSYTRIAYFPHYTCDPYDGCTNPYAATAPALPVTTYFDNIAFGTLPVEWKYFRASKNQNNVALTWATTSEVNSDFFAIERSLDGINFTEISKVSAKGNSAETVEYEHLDQQPLPGTSFYRLKQFDFDGSFEYSNVQIVKNEVRSNQVKVFPNPLNKNDNLQIIGSTKEDLKVKIYDINGRLVLEQIVLDGSGEIPLESLQNNTYFYKISGKNTWH